MSPVYQLVELSLAYKKKHLESFKTNQHIQFLHYILYVISYSSNKITVLGESSFLA